MIPPIPVDADTWLKVQATVDRAQQRGADLAEELNRQSLLLTPIRIKDAKLKSLSALLELLENYTPAEFLRRKFLPSHSCTPADMLLVIREFVEEFIAATKEDR